MSPYHRTVYREVPLKVRLNDNGTINAVQTMFGDLVTTLLTDEQKDELAAQVKREMEEEI